MFNPIAVYRCYHPELSQMGANCIITAAGSIRMRINLTAKIGAVVIGAAPLARSSASARTCILGAMARRPTPFLAIFLNLLAATAHGAPLNCEHSPKEFVLARVVTTHARINFIAGSERKPTCPSPKSTCKLKAFLVPGDEVLMNPAEGPYVCATFKAQNRIESTGFLPRQALQMVPPEQTSPQKWDGKWLRDSEAEIVIKSREDEVEVSGTATWGGQRS
jgi:hypothetical protein